MMYQPIELLFDFFNKIIKSTLLVYYLLQINFGNRILTNKLQDCLISKIKQYPYEN